MTAVGAAGRGPGKVPLYWRVLRLRHLRPNAWQRAVLVEGVILLAVVLVLADVASAWTLLVLPTVVAAMVKAHDVLSGWLARPARAPTTEPAQEGTTVVAADKRGTVDPHLGYGSRSAGRSGERRLRQLGGR